jgi:hypothetical protein
MPQSPLRNTVLIALGAIAMALAAVNWWVLGLSPGSSPSEIGSGGKTPAPIVIAPPHDAAPISDFAEIVRRPLFNADRRPTSQPSGPKAPTASGDRPPEFRLTGVAIAAERRQALLQISGQPRAYWVEEGGSIDGWLLQSVRDNAVILLSGQQQYELLLYPVRSP